jgi:hypothetical protein
MFLDTPDHSLDSSESKGRKLGEGHALPTEKEIQGKLGDDVFRVILLKIDKSIVQ